MNIRSAFAMRDARALATALSALKAAGYRCLVDDSEGWLLVVEHEQWHEGTVRAIVLRSDPEAIIVIL